MRLQVGCDFRNNRFVVCRQRADEKNVAIMHGSFQIRRAFQ